MCLCLSLGDDLKYTHRLFFRLGRKRGAPNDGPYISEIAMLMVMMTMRIAIMLMRMMVIRSRVIVVTMMCVRVFPIHIAKEPCHIVVVILMSLVDNHIKVTTFKGTDTLSPNPNLISLKAQTRQRLLETLFTSSHVKQRAHYHIATYTGIAL
jgi:hypothetical protein